MGVFIFVIGGAYLLYKYVEEEKDLGKKGGYKTLAIAAFVAALFVAIYRVDPDFSFLHPDTVIGTAFMFASILTIGGGVILAILGMNDKQLMSDLPKFLVAKFIVLFVILSIVTGIAELVFTTLD